MNKDTAIVKKETGGLITMPPDAARAAVTQIFSQQGLGLSQFDLTRLKVPSGGGTAWAIPSITGKTQHLDELECVIVYAKSGEKIWYRESFDKTGGGVPPDCASHDGLTGFGINEVSPSQGAKPSQHDCGTCPWNQWKSNRKGGNGKDCRDIMMLLVVRLNSRLPDLIVVPPTSLKAIKTCGLGLLNEGKSYNNVVTSLKLEQEKGGPSGGISYSTIVPTFKRELTMEEAATILPVTEVLREQMEKGAIQVTAEDVE